MSIGVSELRNAARFRISRCYRLWLVMILGEMYSWHRSQYDAETVQTGFGVRVTRLFEVQHESTHKDCRQTVCIQRTLDENSAGKMVMIRTVRWKDFGIPQPGEMAMENINVSEGAEAEHSSHSRHWTSILGQPWVTAGSWMIQARCYMLDLSEAGKLDSQK